MAAAAYVISREPSHLLAVLVIATPCPLLIAAPISFLGGLNKASKKNIIVKRPGTLEAISQITTIFFDKTGTLTLGEPRLKIIRSVEKFFSEETLLGIAAAIEIHSLHPLAKAVMRAKAEHTIPDVIADKVREDVGAGIMGTVDGKEFLLKKSSTPSDEGIAIDLFSGKQRVGQLIFEDQIKTGTAELLRELGKRYRVAILTGDTVENAERVLGGLGVAIHASRLPENKFAIIKDAQSKGEKVMMVGDGLNDAPALALADVGVVFSGNENSSSIEAAAVAILSRDVNRVRDILDIANRSIHIARQSILWGIGLSVVGMIFAMFGFIPPVTGAILQEGIDVTVVLNALRAAA
jgi:P-type E1-E2 ATPase